MKKIIFPAVACFVVLSIFNHSLPEQHESAVPVAANPFPAVGEIAQDMRDNRSNTFSSSDETMLSSLDFEEAKDGLSNLTREGLIEMFNPEPPESIGFIEAMTNKHPLDGAESLYELVWSDFVESLGLSNSENGQLRDLFIAHEAHNIELRQLAWTDQISVEEQFAARRSLEQLAESLEVVLSVEQIGQFWEETRRQSEESRKSQEHREAQRLANGEVGILDASGRNDTASVQAYVNSGADVNAITVNGQNTPLLYAAREGNMEMTRMLLEAGADPNLASTDGYESTPLKKAAQRGHTEIIRALVEAGADIDFASQDLPGLSALATASHYGQADAVAVLLDLGADATGKEGASALTDAIEYNNREIELMLIDAGAPENDILVISRRGFREIGRRLGVIND